MKPIWRGVISTTERMNPGWRKSRYVGGSRRLHLSCGHYALRKISDGTPKRARCHKCENLRDGSSVGTDFDLVTKTKHWQEWDAATEMPVDRSEPMTEKEIKEWIRDR